MIYYDKHKARLVARGFVRKAGIDYEQSFSPTPKLGSIILLIMMANKNSWIINQLDVKSAFLNGTLDYPVYCRPPEGLKIPSGSVLMLKKALYGLQEAGRQWFEKYKEVVLNFGYKQGEGELCYFHYGSGLKSSHIIIYVDDQIITGDNDLVNQTIIELEKHFEMTKSKGMSSFLGIEFMKKKGFMNMYQPGSIESIIEKFEMKEAKPGCTIPLL